MWQTGPVARTDTTVAIRDSVSDHRHSGQPTPAEVLGWLPKNATPTQQDSAIQAHIKPSEIHWSEQPDTLHLPGHPIGKSYREVSLPKYYKESFFAKDSLFHPELNGGRAGVAGDPIPYSVAGDSLITGLLLGCFVLALIAFSKSRRFVVRQTKRFFYVQHGRTSAMTETAEEMRFQLFFVLQTCLLISLIAFFYTRAYVSETFVVEHYQVIGIYAIIFATYFLLKAIVYWFSNWVFFDRQKGGQWMESNLFMIFIEGVVLFPVVMLLAYFNLSIQSAIVYTIIATALFKLLTLYKAYLIFFRQGSGFLQIILYFCALEGVPLLMIWGVFETTNNYLKVNF